MKICQTKHKYFEIEFFPPSLKIRAFAPISTIFAPESEYCLQQTISYCTEDRQEKVLCKAQDETALIQGW